ncbi:hypothetical protein ES708_03695 [subsurface metagenome]
MVQLFGEGIMRTLSDDLLATQQKTSFDPAVKIVLSKAGKDDVTILGDFEEESRIKDLKHFDSPWRINHKGVVLDNRDGFFTDLDLKGYQAVVSWGAKTKSGKEYSATSPMKVTWQQFDSSPGKLTCELNLLGIPDLMDMDEASDDYIPSESREDSDYPEESTQETDYTLIKEIELTEDLAYARVSFKLKTSDVGNTAYGRVYKNGVAVGTIRSNAAEAYQTFSEDFTSWLEGDLIQIYAKSASATAYVRSMEVFSVDAGIYKTIKTLLTEIAGATLPVFSHRQAYEIVWDNDEVDDPLLLYQPKSSFRIYHKDSRMACFKKALEFTGCVARFESDGKIHILIPTTTGESFDYQYSLRSGHPFLSRAYRQTMVFPNKVVVESEKDADPQYSGSAQIDGYDALPDDLKKPKYFRFALRSNEEAGNIAAAILGRAKLNAEMGVANALMNCGAEVYDYVQVADEIREDTTRTGNHGWLERHFNPERSIYHFSFGFGDPPIVRHTKDLYSALKSETGVSFNRLSAIDAYIENLSITNLDALWLDPDGNIDSSQFTPAFLDNIPQGESYGLKKRMHLDASGLYFDSDTIYTLRLPGSEIANLWKGDDPPASYVESDIWIDTSGESDVVKRYDGADWQVLPAADVAELEKGIFIREVKSAALTPDGLVLLDEVDTSGEFGVVKKAALTPAGLVLLDQTIEGTYGHIFKTSIEAGRVRLSAVIEDSAHRVVSDTEKAIWTSKPDDMDEIDMGVAWGKPKKDQITAYGYLNLNANTNFDGLWYNEWGVHINALTGIDIYGKDSALTTRAYAGGPVQCYVGTDGKIYAGAGAVALGSGGVVIKGAKLIFKTAAGASTGYIYKESGYDLVIDPSTFHVKIYSHLLPYSNEIYSLGLPTKRWSVVFAESLDLSDGYIDLPIRATNPPFKEGRMWLCSADNNIYAYVNGSRQTLHNY